MPTFLTPYPPALSPSSELQALSGSSSSSTSTSNASSKYFDRVSRDSSSSAYLTDVTPPSITPSHTNFDREHGKSVHDDSISSDPLIGPFKRLFASRILRERKAVDAHADDDAGYTTDCETENTPLLDAVDAVQARLKQAGPTVNTQRALKIMEQHTSTAPNALDLLDEPLLVPSMPAMKDTVPKAEEALEDWSGEFDLSESNIKDTIPTPLPEETGPAPIQNISFPITKDQIWHNFAANEYEKAFHEGVAEDAGRSFFPDEIKLHPAGTFAFGTGGISGWREEPAPVSAVPALQSALSPSMPPTPVIRPLDESWEASSLVLNSPSLVFDSSASISQMLISPQNLDAGPTASSPGVLDISHINPNSPLNSPLMAISTLMFSARRTQPAIGDVLNGVQNLDLPALLRLEIAATMASQRLQTAAATLAEEGARVGLGLDIAPSQLPESSFPSCNSLPSIYSLPSWSGPATSTPPLAGSANMDTTDASIYLDAEDLSAMVDASVTETHAALSAIAEETSGAAGVAMAESVSQIVGLGLGALVESTLQSSASISRLRSEQPHAEVGPSASTSLADMVGPYHGSVDHRSYSVIESSGIFDGFHNISLISDNSTASADSGIEPSGVLPDMAFLEPRRFAPGVENWLLMCSEIEPLAPLEVEIISDSPVASNVNVESACSSASEIEPFGVLSDRRSVCRIFARPAISAVLNPPPPLDGRLPPRTAGAPRPRRQSQLRESFVASDLEGGERDPRSPVSPARPVAASPTSSPAPDAAIDTVTHPLPASTSAGSCTHSAGRRSLKSSKSAEGLGMGLPSDLASLPPRQREATSSGVDDTASMMSTAEECLDLSRLAASPTSSAGSPNVMVSEERRGTRVFFKIPRFARRTLYAIPEVASPAVSSVAAVSPPSAAASPMGRSLSAAWSDLASRLRSPGKSSGTPRFTAAPLPPSAPLAGPSGDAPAATVAATPLSSASPPNTSCLPQPPRLVPRQPRTSWLARLSRGSLSPSPPQPRSPGMTEHLDAPRNGVPKRTKAGHFVRKLQMLF